MQNLILILGDQLSLAMSSLKGFDPKTDFVVMAELHQEAHYVPHHKQKIAFLFSAMRHFADELVNEGYPLHYQKYDDEATSSNFTEFVAAQLARGEFERVIITEPGEYRLLKEFESWREQWSVAVEIRNDDRFLISHSDFQTWAGDHPKQLKMENFYRRMRKKLHYLMEGDQPIGGKWNYDQENRNPLPKEKILPSRPTYKPSAITQNVLSLVERHFGDNFGTVDGFAGPVTHRDAAHYLDWFIANALPEFGTYQDAMKEGEPLLFHSHISQLINCGLLDPREACEKAEAAFHAGHAPLNAVEGFIRQIIGWREFIRGIYWLKMPEYAELNALSAKRPLPHYFWSRKTNMNCIKQAVTDTHNHAYAHHIQRLMVIGNFCLIAGIDPKQVQEWFLAVYHDAYEWVELPNVNGMALYADGGFFATKPYAASGSYIHKMSDYCGQCHYKVKAKTGEEACPFNTLYWDFVVRNKPQLGKNHRMAMIYKSWERMNEEKRLEVLKEAQQRLQLIEEL